MPAIPLPVSTGPRFQFMTPLLSPAMLDGQSAEQELMAQYETRVAGDGRRHFRKFASPADQLRAEAEGLAALAASGAVHTPGVVSLGAGELVTEYIEAGADSDEGWAELGRQLAALQSIEQPCFGFASDNYCGDTPQPNPRLDDGYEFFASYRLAYQGRLAADAGLLESDDLNRLDRLCQQLPSLVPHQPPVLLHGDLWRGNVLFDAAGRAVLIDPACYWGWAEADIAMTTLFGGFGFQFYESWVEAAQPEPGWRERLPLYNLYHLLNHLNLFGRSYLGGVREVLARFT